MKALSVRQPWANMIASGGKTIETRLWETQYRGDLLICSSRTPDINPAGFALAIVRMVGCRRMTQADELAACCELYPGAYAWLFEDVRPVDPFPVRGYLGLFDVDAPGLHGPPPPR